MKYLKIIIILGLLAACTGKEKIYISLMDLPGYYYIKNDSTDIRKVHTIEIHQTGKLSHQWWVLEIDPAGIKVADFKPARKNIIINSPYFIINNYGMYINIEAVRKYDIFIIDDQDEVSYLLPVKTVLSAVE